jgi:hypothetical protein
MGFLETLRSPPAFARIPVLRSSAITSPRRLVARVACAVLGNAPSRRTLPDQAERASLSAESAAPMPRGCARSSSEPRWPRFAQRDRRRRRYRSCRPYPHPLLVGKPRRAILANKNFSVDLAGLYSRRFFVKSRGFELIADDFIENFSFGGRQMGNLKCGLLLPSKVVLDGGAGRCEAMRGKGNRKWFCGVLFSAALADT